MSYNMNTSEDEEPCCDICGDPHKLKYVQALKCNHSYHYECILKAFLCDRKRHNQCPLCRQSHGLLPLVNGLTKIVKGIHYLNEYPVDYVQLPCPVILKSGKRKGFGCGSKCIIGLSMCKRHHTAILKKEDKEKNKKVGLGDALEQVQLEQALEVTGTTA